MEFDLQTTAATAVVVIVAGVGGLTVSGVMPTDVVLTMVLPSMVVFAFLMLALGVKHGEYRAAN